MVQRIPVRLEIGAVHPSITLRAGMTVSVSIDTERKPTLIGVIGNALAWKSERE